MALKTLKVGDLQRLLAGLPVDQDVLLIDDLGDACEIADIDPLTVVDVATGKSVLTLEILTFKNTATSNADYEKHDSFGLDYSDENKPTINSDEKAWATFSEYDPRTEDQD